MIRSVNQFKFLLFWGLKKQTMEGAEPPLLTQQTAPKLTRSIRGIMSPDFYSITAFSPYSINQNCIVLFRHAFASVLGVWV